MYSLPYFLTFATLLCVHLSFANVYQDAYQVVMQMPDDGKPNTETAASNVPKIAIIGAGITGASSAHHLHQLTRLRQPLDVIVFDSEDKVGGRIRSAHIHNEPGYDVESGASAFTEDDWCLKEAMREVGLKPVSHSRADYHTGIWDGNDFLVRYDNSDKPLSSTWWWSPKWLWRYGSSLPKVQEMVKSSAESFSSFAGFHSFLKLSERLAKSFSRPEVLLSASAFFENNQVSAKVIDEIVRGESRSRHARDLDQVNVLSSMLALRSAPDLSIYQGNQRLPHRMLKISEAQIRLNTRVSRIASGENRRWKVHALTTNLAETEPSTFNADFDIIILTAPFAFNGIDIDPQLSTLASITEVRPYVERYITLFSTLHRLSPNYFNQSANTTIPENIFTAPRQPASEGGNEIFSITIADRVPPPGSGDYIDELEYVYKIVSSKPIPDDEIARLLGHHIESPDKDSQIYEPLQNLGVTWVHRQAWPHAYPHFTSGRPILDDIEIAPDLYYTAAAEEVLSTMEMGCRMGLNVAKHLYYSKWSGETYP